MGFFALFVLHRHSAWALIRSPGLVSHRVAGAHNQADQVHEAGTKDLRDGGSATHAVEDATGRAAAGHQWVRQRARAPSSVQADLFPNEGTTRDHIIETGRRSSLPSASGRTRTPVGTGAGVLTSCRRLAGVLARASLLYKRDDPRSWPSCPSAQLNSAAIYSARRSCRRGAVGTTVRRGAGPGADLPAGIVLALAVARRPCCGWCSVSPPSRLGTRDYAPDDLRIVGEARRCGGADTQWARSPTADRVRPRLRFADGTTIIHGGCQRGQAECATPRNDQRGRSPWPARSCQGSCPAWWRRLDVHRSSRI